MSFNSKQRLDVNLTMTFVELGLSVMSMLGTERERMLEKARGSYAPYRIWNRTGYPLFIWSDTDGAGSNKETSAKQIPVGKTIDWRFDDWKTMREVSDRIYASSTADLNYFPARLLKWPQQYWGAGSWEAMGTPPQCSC